MIATEEAELVEAIRGQKRKIWDQIKVNTSKVKTIVVDGFSNLQFTD